MLSTPRFACSPDWVARDFVSLEREFPISSSFFAQNYALAALSCQTELALAAVGAKHGWVDSSAHLPAAFVAVRPVGAKFLSAWYSSLNQTGLGASRAESNAFRFEGAG